jgi:hypothetical protein
MKKKLLLISLLLLCSKIFAQEAVKKITATAGEGVIVVGYVNNGAYINFTGPSLKLVHKPYMIWLGVLPSLRIKNDDVPIGAKKNSVLTPALGAGLTLAYKHIALQVPIYYNAKTATSDGLWHLGVGLGYKF